MGGGRLQTRRGERESLENKAEMHQLDRSTDTAEVDSATRTSDQASIQLL